MEALKILEGKPQLNWEYDEEADVLYISVGEPRPIKKGIVVVAGHPGKDVAPGTLKSIWKQAELEERS